MAVTAIAIIDTAAGPIVATVAAGIAIVIAIETAETETGIAAASAVREVIAMHRATGIETEINPAVAASNVHHVRRTRLPLLLLRRAPSHRLQRCVSAPMCLRVMLHPLPPPRMERPCRDRIVAISHDADDAGADVAAAEAAAEEIVARVRAQFLVANHLAICSRMKARRTAVSLLRRVSRIRHLRAAAIRRPLLPRQVHRRAVPSCDRWLTSSRRLSRVGRRSCGHRRRPAEALPIAEGTSNR